MAVSLTTINNISRQAIPILINAIATNKASADSQVDPNRAEQTQIAPGSALTIETKRVDLGQLEQIARKRLITFSTTT